MARQVHLGRDISRLFKRILDQPAVSGQRRVLPQGRSCESFDLHHNNQQAHVSVGFYPDHSLGEVFIDAHKAGTDMDAILKDWATTMSIAIQHGTPIATVRHAVTRTASNEPSSIIGAILDQLVRFDERREP